MTTNNTTQQCTVEDWCALRNDHVHDCRTKEQITPKTAHPAVSELFMWLPEWIVVGLFLFVALVAGGLLSLGCLLISLGTVVWIVGNRAVVRRRNQLVLRAYEQNHELVAADAQLLENGRDR
jgi:hypothetical protein